MIDGQGGNRHDRQTDREVADMMDGQGGSRHDRQTDREVADMIDGQEGNRHDRQTRTDREVDTHYRRTVTDMSVRHRRTAGRKRHKTREKDGQRNSERQREKPTGHREMFELEVYTHAFERRL